MNISTQSNLRKSRLIPGIAATLLLAAGAWLAFFSHSDPVYKGRPLPVWLRELEPSEPTAPEARKAIRAIGPAALPYLISELGFKYSAPRRFVFNYVRVHLLDICRSGPFSTWFYPGDAGRHWRAMLAIEELGTNAVPAIPQIAKLLGDPRTAFSAARALGSTGPDAVPILTALLNDPKAQTEARRGAAEGAGSLGDSGGALVPTLIRCLHDQDEALHVLAARSLGWVRTNPQDAVPALAACLSSSSHILRLVAIGSLGNYRQAAKSAESQLTNLANDPDQVIRQTAAIALNKINGGPRE